jgi:hypothetical protein
LPVKATFIAFEEQLTVDTSSIGSTLVDLGAGDPPINCGQCSLWIPTGRAVHVTPYGPEPIGFKRFEGDCLGEDPGSCDVLMDRPRHVRAVFEGLNLVFVTSEPVDGGIVSVAQADAICQQLGHFHFNRTYRAWLSTPTASAISRLGNARGFMTMVQERRVADTAESLLEGRLMRALNEDENGDLIEGVAIATGTRADGGVGNTCDSWSSSKETYLAGDTSLSSTGFTEASEQPCDGDQHLLCIEVDRHSTLMPLLPNWGSQHPNRVFTSRGLFVPAGGLVAADQLCAQEAQAAMLPQTYRAALGTTTQSLALSMPTWLARLDNEVAFSGGVVETAMNLAADGTFIGVEPVWLGAGAPATAADTCNDWTDGTTGRVSLAPRQGHAFLDSTTFQSCAIGAHLLCVEVP